MLPCPSSISHHRARMASRATPCHPHHHCPLLAKVIRSTLRLRGQNVPLIKNMSIPERVRSTMDIYYAANLVVGPHIEPK